MSDILIRGMEMPKNCKDCNLGHWISGSWFGCSALGKRYKWFNDEEGRLNDCPLHELPPHGDLIEAEHLAETLDYYIREAGWGDEINEALRWVRDEFIKSETVIVPADKEDTPNG